MAFSWLKGLFGGKKRGTNPYMSVVQKKIDQAKTQQEALQQSSQKKLDSRLDRMTRERQYAEMFADTKKGIKADTKKAFDELQNELKLGGREEPNVGGSTQEQDAPWIPVSSSNVDSIRWVGGRFGLQVKFLKSGWEYEYAVGYQTFVDMLNAPSKGRFVWYALRNTGVPYHRLTAGISADRLAYSFGKTVGETDAYGRQRLHRNPYLARKAAGTDASKAIETYRDVRRKK